MKLAILLAMFICSATALVLYLWPPQGDLEPITEAHLRDLLRRRGQRGDVPVED